MDAGMRDAGMRDAGMRDAGEGVGVKGLVLHALKGRHDRSMCCFCTSFYSSFVTIDVISFHRFIHCHSFGLLIMGKRDMLMLCDGMTVPTGAYCRAAESTVKSRGAIDMAISSCTNNFIEYGMWICEICVVFLHERHSKLFFDSDAIAISPHRSHTCTRYASDASNKRSFKNWATP